MIVMTRHDRKPSMAWLGLAGMIATALATGCQPARRPPRSDAGRPIRAIWVTRWDYRSGRDIAVVMENCRRAGFNHVLFQVRGNGTAFYRSALEPWADELGGRDPGFDPLAVACREAHRRGLRLHAWVNVIPGWRGDKPPTNRRQLYHAHPEWFWRDQRGRREPLGWYSNLNPCLPEVRRYLVAVLREIVARYPVDGLHLDYIRFPNEWHKGYASGARVPDYPRDAKTLALFRRATGRTPEQAPAQWDHWRTAQVDRLVVEIARMVQKVKPGAALTAAVGADPDVAKRTHFQNAPRWIASGLLDAVFPMNYAADMGTFERRLATWSSSRRSLPVVMGIMVDGRDASLIVRQIARASQTGGHFAAFAYNSLFERLDARGRPIRDEDSPARAARRKAIVRVMGALNRPAA